MRKTSKLADLARETNQGEEARAKIEAIPTVDEPICAQIRKTRIKQPRPKIAEGKRAENSLTPKSLNEEVINQKPAGG